MARKPAAAAAFLKRVWRLAAPYWRSEDRFWAWTLLIAAIALSLGLVYINVRLNNWNREFYEALQNKDLASFGPLLMQFTVLAVIYITAAVIQLLGQQWLEIRWRTWLTDRFIGAWLENRAYYRLEIQDRGTDNPDQRIADDLRIFTSNTLDLSLGLLSSVVTLFSFVTILWAISGPLSFALGGTDVTIPGYMVWVAVVYSLVGSVLAHFVGRRLIPLNFVRERVEADFRVGMVRLRENAEGVALYRGEPYERQGLMDRFRRIRANFLQLLMVRMRLLIYSVAFSQLAIIFPILVAAPRYFAGAITLGVLFQVSNAFGQVQGSLWWFGNNYGQLAAWKATVDRLLTFQDALRAHQATTPVVGNGAAAAPAPAAPTPGVSGAAAVSQADALAAGATAGIEVVRDGAGVVRGEDVDLGLPDGRVVLPDASFAIRAGEKVLVSGPTGSGKSTLFRAIAGIWPYGSGRIEVPAEAKMLFLPQRPYIPVASLRDAVTFPAPPGTFGDDEVREALAAVGLAGFAERLDEAQHWGHLMSGGEQQRLALARALLHKPDWLFLDEATAAVDEPSEQHLYGLLHRRLPGTTIVSITHRSTVAEYHEKRLRVEKEGEQAALVEG
jgi:vitamin B12/bleomycin/antimicrobial peptide transport system ATP-binding/permease protein